MKKLIAIACIACSVSAYAQDTTRTRTPTRTPNNNVMKSSMDEDGEKWWDKDGAMMKNGKMFSKVNGDKKEMTQNLTLNNGDVVLPNGTVQMKNGSTRTLQNGECIDMDGNIRTKGDKKSSK